MRGVTAALLLMLATVPASRAAAPEPETVMITFRPKAGAEAALAAVIAKHTATAARLRLLDTSVPHLTLRATEGPTSRAYYVEILTWRDASVPDDAPAELQAIWREMHRLVESRDGRPGIAIVPVTPVARDR